MTPKQDDDEEENIPEDDDASDATTTQKPTVQALLAMFPQQRHEDEEQYCRGIDEIRSQTQPFVTPPDPYVFFTRFYQLNQVHTVNQVCPSGTSEIVKDQGENFDVQRITRMDNSYCAKNSTKPSEICNYLFPKNFSKTVKDMKS